MTFSSINPFPEKKMVCEIDCILRKYGHKPKYKKVKYYTQGRYVPITGTVVTGRHELKVPNKLQKRVYDDFQEVRKYQGIADVLFFVLRFAQMNNLDLEACNKNKLHKNAEKYSVEKSKGKNLKYTEM